MINENPDVISRIQKWYEKTSPAVSDDQTHVQFGLYLNQISKLLFSLQGAGKSFDSREQLRFSADVMNFIQRQVKAGRNGTALALEDVDTIDLLKSLCDQIIIAVGIAHSMHLDIGGALNEIANCNDTQLDTEGHSLFDEQLRSLKGINHRSPDLTSYV